MESIHRGGADTSTLPPSPCIQLSLWITHMSKHINKPQHDYYLLLWISLHRHKVHTVDSSQRRPRRFAFTPLRLLRCPHWQKIGCLCAHKHVSVGRPFYWSTAVFFLSDRCSAEGRVLGDPNASFYWTQPHSKRFWPTGSSRPQMLISESVSAVKAPPPWLERHNVPILPIHGSSRKWSAHVGKQCINLILF